MNEQTVPWRKRLAVQDALWLEMDKPGNLFVVDSVYWTATPIDWDVHREVMRQRLWDRYPVFRSIPVRGDDQAWYWEELVGADIEDRCERVTLPAPGGDAELQELISAQRVVPLDRSDPLWRVVFVDGYQGGSAVLLRTHHAIADGIRMVQLALSMFDPAPEGPHEDAPASHGMPAPSEPQPEEDIRARVSGLAATSVQLARSAMTNPVGAAHTVLALSESAVSATRARLPLGRGGLPPFLAALSGDVDTARKLVLGTRNDTTNWTGPVGERKAVSWCPPLSVDAVKELAQAHGATVNDVLVTCVAESLRAYLDSHHVVCHSVTWDVPVNLTPFDPDLPMTLGNGFAIVQLELPTHLDDPLRTLQVVRRRMGRIKSGHEAQVDFGVQALISRMGGRTYRAAVDLIANRAVGVLTNVPGPQVPLYVAGRKVEGMLGWAPMTANQVMSFTIFSYDGRIFVGLAVDVERVPDHEQIIEGFTDAFHRLVARTA